MNDDEQKLVRCKAEEAIRAIYGALARVPQAEWERNRQMTPKELVMMWTGEHFTADMKDLGDVYLDPDDFPEDVVKESDIFFIMSNMARVQGDLPMSYPENPTLQEASRILLHTFASCLTASYLDTLGIFLGIYDRYHPGRKQIMDPVKLLATETMVLGTQIDCLAQIAGFAQCLFPEELITHLVADKLYLLQLSASAFFDIFERIYGLKSIRDSRTAFNRMMQYLGTWHGVAFAAEYLRLHELMYKDICYYEKHGCSMSRDKMNRVVGEIARSVKSQQSALDGVVNVVNVIQHQMAYLLKRVFRKKKMPSPPAPDPYAALSRIPEVHRLQIKCVIDYTRDHPIVHEGKTADDFTLSNAAHVVWNDHADEWRKMKGAYPDFASFKAACYHFRKKPSDPFCYQT